MKISEIDFVPIQSRDGLIGFASFIYDNAFKISNIGIHTKLNGDIKLIYPGNKHGAFVFPINKQIGIEVLEAVKKEYADFINLRMEGLNRD